MPDLETAPATVADIDAEHGHWNHLLPDADWERVVAEADRIYAERTAAETERGGSDLMPLGLTPRVVRFPDTYGKNSGAIVRQQLWVIHTAECPLRVGYAESLTKWGNGGYQPRASWPRFIDPATRVEWIPNNRAAFLHGPANSLGMGWEQAGYARFTREEWLTPDGLRQLDLLAQDIVACGITEDALRWLTDAQVKAIVERRDTTTRGLCTHAQIDKAVNAGLRTDPGAGYPKDVLLTWTRSYHPKGGNTKPGTPGTARLGDRGDLVREVQTLLVAHGYTQVDVDGVFGPVTDECVRHFQGTRGLDVDGIVGPNTLAALKIPPPPPQEAPTMLTSLLVSGARTGETRSRGPEVTLLQQMLNALRGAKLDVDGSFGPATEAAVKAYQAAKGIAADGRVGPDTRSRLNADWAAYNAPKPPPVVTPPPEPEPSHADVLAELKAVREHLARQDETLNKILGYTSGV